VRRSLRSTLVLLILSTLIFVLSLRKQGPNWRFKGTGPGGPAP